MTNYASTNEPENHDSNYPQMTTDDVADMVCKPVAPASVDTQQAGAEIKLPPFNPRPLKFFDDRTDAERIAALEAENARLQSDLEAAREAFVKIQCLAESLTDGSDSVLSEIVEISRKAWQSIK